MKIQYAVTVPAHETSTRLRFGFVKTDEKARRDSSSRSRKAWSIGRS